MRGPLKRFGRRRPHERAAPAPARETLPADMARGAPEMQLRLEAARSRLKAQTPPRPDDD